MSASGPLLSECITILSAELRELTNDKNVEGVCVAEATTIRGEHDERVLILKFMVECAIQQ